MDVEGIHIAASNLKQAQRWYRSLMAESCHELVPLRQLREARDAVLFYARLLDRALDAAVDARRKEGVI